VADFPESGLPLTELGIEALVPRIDAAAVGLGSLNRRVYLFSGYEYWRLRQDGRRGRMSVDRYYPQEISYVFRGVPPNVDAAFTNVDGTSTTPQRASCRRLHGDGDSGNTAVTAVMATTFTVIPRGRGHVSQGYRGDWEQRRR